MRGNRTAKAFSLTELLVVIAVILVLLSLLIVGTQAVYSNSIRLRCQHRLEQIGHALHMYAAEHRGMLPAAWDMHSGRLWYETLRATQLDDWTILACPASEFGAPNPSTGGGTDPSGRANVEDLLEVLRWLKEKQEPSGRWSYHSDGRTTGSYKGITALALLAYFGFGCTDQYPAEFSETVRNAIQYLCSAAVQQQSDANDDMGWFVVDGYKIMYTQPICTMALAAAARICQDPTLREQARRGARMGVDYILRNSPDHGAYWYGGIPAPGGSSDTSICGWIYQCFAAARVAGVNPTESSWSEVAAMTEQYLRESINASGASTYWYVPPYTSSSGSTCMTGISLTARMLSGGKASDQRARDQAGWLTTTNRHINLIIQRDGKNNYTNYYMSLALFRMGGDYWDRWYKGGAGAPAGYEGYPKLVLKHKQSDGTNSEGKALAFWESDTCYPDHTNNQRVGGLDYGRVYTTCMAALALEAAFEEHWIDPSWTPPTGKCSYGYNNRLGRTRRTLAADTIMVMDYGNWEIDHDDVEVDKNDTVDDMAPRHSGQVNCLLGDGGVRSLYPGEVTEGMFTAEPAD